jgi:hypothetical protein
VVLKGLAPGRTDWGETASRKATVTLSENSEVTHDENRCTHQYYHGLEHIFKSVTMRRISKFKIYKTMLKSVVMYGCETWPE